MGIIPAMELRHLRYFAAVADERHFGRAARRLRIAQPPLSRQVQALETELGFSLFDRSRRRVELTRAGAVLVEHARRVFDLLDLAVRDARRAAAGKTGRITIGYPSSVAFSGLVEVLRAFRARSPEVEVAVRELPPQQQVDALVDGLIDVGFIRGPLEDVGLAAKRVRSEPLVVALPSEHRLAASRRIDLRLLARDPFVTFPRARGPSFFDMLMRLCHEAGFVPRIVQEAPQLDLVSLVAAGFGVAIVPESVRDARRPGVVFRPLAGSPRTDLFVAWRPNDGSLVLRDFLDVVDRIGVRRASTRRRRG